MWTERIRTYGRLIKFSHTIFALPFALAAVLLAHRQQSLTWGTLFWIVVAMGGARSAAMGFNRLVDYRYDLLNPRTASRPLTAGQIDKRSVVVFILLSSMAFGISAAALGPLCLALSIPVLFVLFSYSYTKRFTSLSHLFLGFAIGLAPTGAWIAVTGSLDPRILLLSAALMTYIAGFDILYSCQDIEFDRQEGLFSLPSRRGVRSALRISALLHVLTFFFLLSTHFLFRLGSIDLVALAIIGILLVFEHRLVRPDRLDNIQLAFFHVNSAISILLLVGIGADMWVS